MEYLRFISKGLVYVGCIILIGIGLVLAIIGLPLFLAAYDKAALWWTLIFIPVGVLTFLSGFYLLDKLLKRK